MSIQKLIDKTGSLLSCIDYQKLCIQALLNEQENQSLKKERDDLRFELQRMGTRPYVPAQPAVVPKHAADWFHDMREVLFDIATSDVICDRPEHAFVTVAIDRDTLSRAAILSTTDTEVKK